MSLLRNLLGAFVPVRERRETSGVLAALNAELVLDINGDESALIFVNGGGSAFAGTLEFTGSIDGVNYFAILVMPYFSNGSVAGPNNAQPLLVDVIASTTACIRAYALRVSQLKKVRVRIAAWTSGSATVNINSDAQRSLHPALYEGRPTSLMNSTTGAVSAAVTATLPAVAGLRHYIDFIRITRSATAALTAAATPVVITSTNLPGPLNLTLGQDAGGIGVDRELALDFGGTGLAASAIGTATTIVCPIYTGVMWRVNVGYRLGL